MKKFLVIIFFLQLLATPSSFSMLKRLSCTPQYPRTPAQQEKLDTDLQKATTAFAQAKKKEITFVHKTQKAAKSWFYSAEPESITEKNKIFNLLAQGARPLKVNLAQVLEHPSCYDADGKDVVLKLIAARVDLTQFHNLNRTSGSITHITTESCTPLMVVANVPETNTMQQDIFDALITAGAEIDQASEDQCSFTPLFYAVNRGNKRCTEKLLAMGADANHRSFKTGLLNLSYKKPEIMHALFDAGKEWCYPLYMPPKVPSVKEDYTQTEYTKWLERGRAVTISAEQELKQHMPAEIVSMVTAYYFKDPHPPKRASKKDN